MTLHDLYLSYQIGALVTMTFLFWSNVRKGAPYKLPLWFIIVWTFALSAFWPLGIVYIGHYLNKRAKGGRP